MDPETYPRRLTDRVWLLGNPFFSVYLVRGDDYSALVECGITATAGLILEQIKDLEPDPARVRLLLATHGHADHLAGAPVLKRHLPGLTVASGAPTKGFLEKEKVRLSFRADDDSESARMIDLGGAAEPRLEPGDLAGAVDRALEPGQEIDLGGITLRAMEAPGHAVGGLVFWEPGERMIFCSDSLGFILPPDKFCANFYVSLDSYLDSFETLTGLDPAWVCPGHCGAFFGPDKDYFLAGSRAEIDWVVGKVKARMPLKDPPEDLVEEIMERHYHRQCRMFSPEMMRYCSQLLIRRAAESRYIQA